MLSGAKFQFPKPGRRIVGLIITDPAHAFLGVDTDRRLALLNSISGEKVDIFLAGYKLTRGDKPVVETMSSRQRDRLAADLASMSRWSYEGGTELLIFAVDIDRAGKLAPDFSQCLQIPLADVLDQTSSEDIDKFFASSFRKSTTE